MNLRPLLYAEDEEDDVYLMTRAFEKVGVPNPLAVVRDGQEVVNYLTGKGKYSNREEFPMPCLLLLDLNLPQRSGLEVLKWIRAEPSISTLPVIVLTSSLQDADIHRAYLQGANAYLVKPTHPDELIALVKNIRNFWLLQNRISEQHWDALKPA
jgi:CheY-like chemotaxis protein